MLESEIKKLTVAIEALTLAINSTPTIDSDGQIINQRAKSEYTMPETTNVNVAPGSVNTVVGPDLTATQVTERIAAPAQAGLVAKPFVVVTHQQAIEQLTAIATQMGDATALAALIPVHGAGATKISDIPVANLPGLIFAANALVQ